MARVRYEEDEGAVEFAAKRVKAAMRDASKIIREMTATHATDAKDSGNVDASRRIKTVGADILKQLKGDA